MSINGAHFITVYQIEEPPGAVAFSPDGGTVAFYAPAVAKPSVFLMDCRSGQVTFELAGAPAVAAFSPDGHTVLTTDGRLWDVNTSDVVHTLGKGDGSFSPDGSTIVTADGVAVWAWDAKSGALRRALKHPGAAIIPNATLVVTYGEADTVRFWDIATGTEIAAPRGDWAGISPDRRTFEVFANHQAAPNVSLYEAATGRLLAMMTGDWPVYSPDGNLVAISHDGVTAVWDTQSGEKQHAFPGQVALTPVVTRAARRLDRIWPNVSRQASTGVFSPDSQYVATAADNKVKLWDLATGAQIAVFPGHQAQFNPDNKHIGLCTAPSAPGAGGHFALTEILGGAAEIREFTFDQFICFTPDGAHVFGGDNWNIGIHDVQSGEQVDYWPLGKTPDADRQEFGLEIVFSPFGHEAYITALQGDGSMPLPAINTRPRSGPGGDPFAQLRQSRKAKVIGKVRGVDR